MLSQHATRICPPSCGSHKIGVGNQVVPRTLRQFRIANSIEDTTPFRESQGENNPGSLRVDTMTGRGWLLKNDEHVKSRSILIGLTITNPVG